jgi:hypothetical protein
MSVELKAKCTTCHKTFVMSEAHMKEAREIGVPFSPCCSAVSTVVSATLTLPKKRSRG